VTPASAFDAVLAEGHRMLDLVMADVTPELLSWSPPGTANPIGIVFAHALGAEDLYIQQIIQQQPLLWEKQQWAARLGHDKPPNQWNILELAPPHMDDLRAYQAAVFMQTRAFIQNLADDEFDRQLQFPGRQWSMSVAQLLSVVAAHTLGHAGEIAALKGIQGGKGLPF
jgi:uncharacterized damage-inducible protein DinB